MIYPSNGYPYCCKRCHDPANCHSPVRILIDTLRSLVVQFRVVYCAHDKYCLWITESKATVKPVLSGHSKRRPKFGFQYRLSLNAGQKYCRMLQESILQYFRPSLSYHLSLRPLFFLVLSGRLRQLLLYTKADRGG